MYKAITGIAVLSAALFSGCSGVVCLHPVYTEAVAESDPGLAGAWQLKDEKIFFDVTREDSGAWRIMVEGESPDDRLYFAGRTFKLDGAMFMECTLASKAQGCDLDELTGDLDAFLLRPYYLVRLEWDGDALNASVLNPNWLKDRNKEAQPRVQVARVPGDDKWWFICDDTEKLQHFVRATLNINEAWEGPSTLVRRQPSDASTSS